MNEELEAALIKLHELWWLHIGTFEANEPGYNLISCKDASALDEACEKIEKLLANRKIS